MATICPSVPFRRETVSDQRLEEGEDFQENTTTLAKTDPFWRMPKEVVAYVGGFLPSSERQRILQGADSLPKIYKYVLKNWFLNTESVLLSRQMGSLRKSLGGKEVSFEEAASLVYEMQVNGLFLSEVRGNYRRGGGLFPLEESRPFRVQTPCISGYGESLCLHEGQRIYVTQLSLFQRRDSVRPQQLFESDDQIEAVRMFSDEQHIVFVCRKKTNDLPLERVQVGILQRSMRGVVMTERKELASALEGRGDCLLTDQYLLIKTNDCVEVFDYKKEELYGRFSCSNALLSCVDLDQGRVVFADAEGNMVVFPEIWKDKEYSIRFASGHTGQVTAIAFSPNGKRIFSADANGKIKVWENCFVEWKLALSLESQESPVRALYSSRDSDAVLAEQVIRNHSILKRWDLETGLCSKDIQTRDPDEFEFPRELLMLNPEGTLVLCRYREAPARVFNLAREVDSQLLPGELYCLSEDGQHLLDYISGHVYSLRSIRGLPDFSERRRIYQKTSKLLKRLRYHDASPIQEQGRVARIHFWKERIQAPFVRIQAPFIRMAAKVASFAEKCFLRNFPVMISLMVAGGVLFLPVVVLFNLSVSSPQMALAISRITTCALPLLGILQKTYALSYLGSLACFAFVRGTSFFSLGSRFTTARSIARVSMAVLSLTTYFSGQSVIGIAVGVGIGQDIARGVLNPLALSLVAPKVALLATVVSSVAFVAFEIGMVCFMASAFLHGLVRPFHGAADFKITQGAIKVMTVATVILFLVRPATSFYLSIV